MRRYVPILLLLFATAVGAQQAMEIWGTTYQASPRTLSNRQTTSWRSDSTGKLSTDLAAAGGCNGVVDLSAGCMFPLAH